MSEGLRDPLGTLATNVIGTANLLEAIRATESVRAVVVVATDKVYENPETGQPLAEPDPLGGHDPYSASKAAAELVVASFRASYFGDGQHHARIASARAGNVIGGGDWAADRLVPDCLRAFAAGEPVRLRAPDAVRPWQHVLGPLAGYLALATRLLDDDGPRFARAWNFGPDATDDATVFDVASRVAALWGDDARVEPSPDSTWREAGLLRLDSTLARDQLGWMPALAARYGARADRRVAPGMATWRGHAAGQLRPDRGLHQGGVVSERFGISDTTLPGVRILQREPLEDERGWLERMYGADDLAEVIGSRSLAQVNRTLTRRKGTVRGLHFQVPPSAETKIVSCLRGSVFDVAVDVRRGSPTLLRWHGEVLSAENSRSLVIPEGFAHGVQTLTDDVELLYFHTALYDSPNERGIHPQDPLVGIAWPLPVVQLSERDTSHARLTPQFDGIDL